MIENGYKLFIAIDGNAIVHRAYHAYPPSLVTSQGIQVNAVFGFTVMLLEVLKKYDPHYIFCAFDTKKPTFRHTQFSDYKANRKPMDEGLAEQFPLVEEVVRALNIPIIKKEGYEADDILGTASKYVTDGKWSSDTIKMLLVSGDRDLLQLVNDKVNVCLPQGSFKTIKAFNRAEVFEKYQIYPEQIIEYKAIVGDSSDNIPGVKGIGDKSAIELLTKYETLDGIYKNIDEIKPRYKQLLTEGIEQAELSRELATIKTDVNLDLRLEDCQTRDFHRNDVVNIFNKFEFRSLIDKIPQSNEKEVDDGVQYDLFGSPMSTVDNNAEKVSKSDDSKVAREAMGKNSSPNMNQSFDQSDSSGIASDFDEQLITYEQIVDKIKAKKSEIDVSTKVGTSVDENEPDIANTSQTTDTSSPSIIRADELYACNLSNYQKASKIIIAFFNNEEYVGNIGGNEQLIKIRFIYPQGYINSGLVVPSRVTPSDKDSVDIDGIGRLEVDVVMHSTQNVVDSFVCFTEWLKMDRETLAYNWEEYISYVMAIYYSASTDLLEQDKSELPKSDNESSKNFEESAVNYKNSISKSIPVIKDRVNKLFDIKLFAHLVSSGKRDYSLSALVFDYLGGVFPKRVGENVDLEIISRISDKIKADLHQLKIADLIAKRSDNASNKLSSLYLDCNFGSVGLPDINDGVISSESAMQEKTQQSVGSLKKKVESNLRQKSQNIESNDKEAGGDINCVERTAYLIENRISCILAEMENRGLCVNPEQLEMLKKDLVERINSIEQEVYYYVGHEFNINSPKQLSEVLFTHLNINTGAIVGKKKGKTGLSTREEILVELQDAHPIISRILEYRELNKMLTTYVDVLIRKSNESYQSSKKEYVINTDFKQIGTSSGRFSSVNPNLQNIPIKGDWSKRIREVFVPRRKFKYVSIDYSQIEFRVMADVSGDKALREIFNNRQDIHRATASKIFDKPEDLISSEERGRGKTLNFAVLYGLTPFGLSRQLKITQAEASKYINDYFEKYFGVAQYIENSTKEALVNGYVQSMFGRRRYIYGLDSKNRNIKSAAIREAINMPIQGSASDLMKIAMIAIDDLIMNKYSSKAFLLLQIHDEIILEVGEDILEDFEKDAVKVMTEIVQLEVPLEVHFSSGNNMAELK